MQRTMVSIDVGSSNDEVRSGNNDVRLKTFDRLVSGEQTEEGPYEFDGLSALPASSGRLDSIEDAIGKLKEAFSKAAL